MKGEKSYDEEKPDTSELSYNSVLLETTSFSEVWIRCRRIVSFRLVCEPTLRIKESTELGFIGGVQLV